MDEELELETAKSILSPEEQIRATDPRDYFLQTAFQKKARSLDSDPNHPWETFPDQYLYISDEEGSVCVTRIYDQKIKSTGLLIASQSKDQVTQSAYLTTLEPATRDFLLDTVSLVLLRFTGPQRQAFIAGLLETVDQLQDPDPNQAAEKIATLALSHIEDLPDSQKIDQLPKPLPKVNYGTPEATEAQQEQLTRIFSLASTKIPHDDFENKISEFYDNISSTDHIYGQSFRYLFVDALRWVIDFRLADQEPVGELGKDLVKPFPLKKLIKREILNIGEAKATLEKQTVKSKPDTGYMTEGDTVATFVELDKIVGGPGIENWAEISRERGRGLERTMHFIQGFSNGTIDLMGKGEPIKAHEING